MPAVTGGLSYLLAPGLAFAWLAGMRVYLTAFAVGIAGARGWIGMPADLHFLASPWAIGACATLAAVECVVDKVPGLDGGWDLLHTAVRIPAGAGIGAALLAHGARIDARSWLIAGAAAAFAHTIKTATRRRINTSPEPLSNWSASLAEDLACAAALVLAFTHPRWALALAAGASLAIATVAARSFRAPGRPGPVGAAA